MPLPGKANNLEEANQFHWTAAHFVASLVLKLRVRHAMPGADTVVPQPGGTW